MLRGMQQINSEVTRMTGIDVRAKLSKFMTASRVDSILKLVSRGKVDQLLLDVAEAPGKSANYDVQSMFDFFGIFTIFLLFIILAAAMTRPNHPTSCSHLLLCSIHNLISP